MKSLLEILVGQVTMGLVATLGGLCQHCGGDTMLAGLVMAPGEITLVGTVMISGGDVGRV